MNWIALLVGLLLFVLGGACVFAVVVQLPGTWLFLLLALAVELADGLYLPDGERTTFGREVWIAGLALATLGEVLEFVAGAIGVKKGGGSRRGLVGALVGGLLGVFLTPLFFFVPVFGVFLAVLLGTFVGAWLGELSHARSTMSPGTVSPSTISPSTISPSTMRTALGPALWAALGRLLGTTGKVALAIVVWLVFTVSAFWR